LNAIRPIVRIELGGIDFAARCDAGRALIVISDFENERHSWIAAILPAEEWIRGNARYLKRLCLGDNVGLNHADGGVAG
jgi:hypothetical protein